MQQNQKLIYGISVAALIALVLCLLFYIGFLSNIQSKISDGLYGGKTPLNNVVIVSIDDKSLQEIGRWPWQRENFAKLIDKLNESAVLAIDVAFFESSDSYNDLALYNALKNSNNVVLTMEYTSFENKNSVVYGKEHLLPLSEFDIENRTNIKLGYVNVITDKDGVTRAVNMDVRGDYESFVVQAYKIFTQKELSAQKEKQLKNPRFLINYADKPHSFRQYSFSDIMDDRVDVAELKNAVVFVGSTAPDLHDEFFVPTSGGKAMPGVEVHANTFQTIATNRYLNEEPVWLNLMLIFLISIICFLTIYKFDLLWGAIINFGLMILYVVMSIFIFEQGIIMNMISIPITVVVSYTGSAVFLYVAEKRQKKKLKDAFGKYVSKTLVDEIMKNPDNLKLGGQKKEITIFFSDIRGFTSLSEKLEPEELIHILNEYLTEMTKIVMKHNGMVDKYIGDAIMALWNVPLDDEKHASEACLAALEMKAKIPALNEKWKKEGHLREDLHIGIGLNTGFCIVGNVGSEERFDYTAISDAVNLASRLEGLNKEYGTTIIVSENTHRLVEDFTFRELDYVAVKGKKEPIRIFELTSDKTNDSFEKGLKLYRDKKFEMAIKEFMKNNDKTSQIFVERCNYFIANTPSPDWDYVWVMKGK